MPKEKEKDNLMTKEASLWDYFEFNSNSLHNFRKKIDTQKKVKSILTKMVRLIESNGQNRRKSTQQQHSDINKFEVTLQRMQSISSAFKDKTKSKLNKDFELVFHECSNNLISFTTL